MYRALFSFRPCSQRHHFARRIRRRRTPPANSAPTFGRTPQAPSRALFLWPTRTNAGCGLPWPPHRLATAAPALRARGPRRHHGRPRRPAPGCADNGPVHGAGLRASRSGPERTRSDPSAMVSPSMMTARRPSKVSEAAGTAATRQAAASSPAHHMTSGRGFKGSFGSRTLCGLTASWRASVSI